MKVDFQKKADVVPPTAASLAPVAIDLPENILSPTEASLEKTDNMKIRLKLEDTKLTATLVDSKTTRDFIALLPLTLTLEDYGDTEKISYLPRRLSTVDAPSAIDPSVGDITYYTPLGEFCDFYKRLWVLKRTCSPGKNRR